MSNSLQDRLILLLIASLENLQLFLCKEGKEFDLNLLQKDFSNKYVRNKICGQNPIGHAQKTLEIMSNTDLEKE
jgi:hypothetical protein